MLACSLIGAPHIAGLRASWGQESDRADVMRTRLWLWLAVPAALGEDSGVDAHVARHEGLVKALAMVVAPASPPAEG